MIITIKTDGSFNNTEIALDGKRLEGISKMAFSIRIDEYGIKRPAKMQISFLDKNKLPISLYAGDFSELENRTNN